MLSGEHWWNNNLKEQELKKKTIPALLQIHTIGKNVFYSEQFITRYPYRQFLTF